VSRHHEATAVLSTVRDIIAERAAGAEPPSWCVRREWVEFLGGLPEGFVLAAERDGLAAHVVTAPGAPPDLIALAQAVSRVTDLPRAAGSRAEHVDTRRASWRKRAQVAAFAELVARLPRPPSRIVDVGSGHGHLTRHLARTAGVPAEGWERDPARVAVASALIAGGSVRFVTADLRDAGEVLSAHDLVVGLHACGELSDLAVRAARQAGASVALVGCCLQKRPGDRVPLVVPPGLTAEALTVPRAALGLANTRTGDEGIEADLETRTRARWNRFALGRALQVAGHPVAPGEELRGVNRRRATGDFAALAALAFQARGLARPTRAALDEAARASAPDFERERRWALPRAMLGRLIEVWAALDRGAFLAAAGYRGEVVVAFDTSASPRNVALLGWHP
jgi:SAM-dependent methyltransferase